MLSSGRENRQGRDLANRKPFPFPKAGDSGGVLWYPNLDILSTDSNIYLDHDRILMAPTLPAFQACSDGPTNPDMTKSLCGQPYGCCSCVRILILYQENLVEGPNNFSRRVLTSVDGRVG